MTEGEPFVKRWARLKQEARAEPGLTEAGMAEAPPPAALPVTQPPAECAPADEARDGDEPLTPKLELPSIESLGRNSDYSMFLRAEVPEHLRRQALRKLWLSDPVLALPEVMDLHNLDYTHSATTEVVSTLFRVGKGMIDAAEALVEKQTEENRAEAERIAKNTKAMPIADGPHIPLGPSVAAAPETTGSDKG